ncbi:tumor necrosis factor receptor superfamily member 26-like isoform X2 [Rana temporaria]|uniref:tumor necrosis factor receptor superfamily member 26-like isoform X2 n=1 Tax=Rana temporaria TaxID=8407 RepID=UPI001AADA300|nr:tumor necrosis factor receptor superfamily member 26-like isoform X2 [Rana temporaria]
MDTIRRAPRGTALFYVLTITTAFGFLENITEGKTAPSIEDRIIFTCDDNEYLVSNRCCQKCPARTRVSISCSVNHGLGDCRNCITGKDFTAFPNGLNTCLPCRACRGDEVVVEECTLTRNTLCKCKQGTYLCQANMNCSSTGTCSTCSSCPEGQGIKYPCNATANTVCEDLVEMSIPNLHQIGLIIGLSVATAVILLLIGFIICGYRHRRKRKEDHPVKDQTAADDNFPDNVSNSEFSDSEQHSNRSSIRLINDETFPDIEYHSFPPHTPMMDTKEDPPNGSIMSSSEDCAVKNNNP